jgi:hypothetical protein
MSSGSSEFVFSEERQIEMTMKCKRFWHETTQGIRARAALVCSRGASRLLPLLVLAAFFPWGAGAATTTYLFTYPNRAALLAAGWSYIATPARNTEITTGAIVSYDQVGHPGVLRIPCDAGNLWGAANDTRNSLFQALSTNWVSLRLQVTFAPVAAGQQAQLALYQDDDNYLEVGHALTSSGEVIALSREDGGVHATWSPLNLNTVSVAAGTVYLRLDRDLATDKVTALFSTDGANWVTVGASSQTFVNPKVCIWTGGSSGGLPNCDLSQLDVITSDTALGPLLFAQPQNLVFSTVAGQACTNVQQLRLFSRRSSSPVGYTVSSDSAWLTNSASSGTTAGTCDVSIVGAASLPAGVYQGHLTCAAPGAVPGVTTVTLIINPGRTRVSTWQGAKSGAMSVWIDGGNPTAFDALSTNGFGGTYLLPGGVGAIPAFAASYYLAGMNLGAATVDSTCFGLDEPSLRYELEYNIAAISAASGQSSNSLVSFGWPCGFTTVAEEAIAGDYFLAGRSYNVNQLEDATPYDFMKLKSFNTHADSPAPPADLKTVVDAAVSLGKWFNMVLTTTNTDDGAIVYSKSKDIWVAPSSSVAKYILQRDRSIITNYTEAAGQIAFGCYRLPMDTSGVRGFENAIGPQDTVTLQVDVTGVPAVTNVLIAGVSTPFSTKVAGIRSNVLFAVAIGTTVKNVQVQFSATSINHAPVLPSQTFRVVNELNTMTVINTASDADGATQTLTYTLANPPAGAQIDTNGIITWTPVPTQGPGTYTLTTIVMDSGFPAMSATNSFTVTVNEVNQPPVLPAQANRTVRLPGGSGLVVVNTATNAVWPPVSFTYQLLSAPPGAAIDGNGIITWTPTLAQVPSTNVFTTVATDYDPLAISNQRLSATNTFLVYVLPPNMPWLPSLPNLTIAGAQLMVVTNTATEAALLMAASNTYDFSYQSRTNMFADGWDFVATNPDGTPRPTEITDSADPRIVSYDQVAHPGFLQIPCDGGDLWGAANTSINTLFHHMPANWLTMQLDLTFNPNAQVQQAHLGVYQDDDNYLQVGMAYNPNLSPPSNSAMTVVWEKAGITDHLLLPLSPLGNIRIRLDQSPVDGSITGFYSLDGINWQVIGTVVNQYFTSPRLFIWGGGSLTPFVAGGTVLNLHRLDLTLPGIVTNSLSYQLINPPRGATVDSNGVIRWVPTDPGNFVITTVVTDSIGQTTTNNFNVSVPTPAPPVLPSLSNATLSEGQSLQVTNAANDPRYVYPWTTNTFNFAYASRTAFTNDGWSFTATTGASLPRPTEAPTGDIASIIYNAAGPLRIPCSTGDLWAALNNSVNSLFRSLPTNWCSMRLNLNFTPTTSAQQVHLTVYQNDDNYAQVGVVYNTTMGGLAAAVNLETSGSPSTQYVPWSSGDKVTIRLDRSIGTGVLTGLYSSDGSTWLSIGTVTQAFANPRLCIWAGGGNRTIMPPVDLIRLDVVTTNNSPVTVNYTLVNAPTNATISTGGVINWTPTEAQGPSTNVITTIVTDTGIPPASATNQFTVVVNEINLPPVLPNVSNFTIGGVTPVVVTNTAVDPDIPVNALTYVFTGPVNAAIDTNGVIRWTPLLSQIPSTNTFTTVVTDFNPLAVNNQHLSATNSFTVVVTTTHNGPSLPFQPNLTIAEMSPLTVTNTAVDTDVPVRTVTYSLFNPPTGVAIDANGIITWTPSEAQGPSTNVITTIARDNGTPVLSTTNSFTVVVDEINVAPVLPAQTNRSLLALQPLVVTNTATDSDIPINTLTYQLTSMPAGAAIDTNGVITWTPTVAQVPSTNVFTTVVTDYNSSAVNSQHLSATNSFIVTVYPIRNGPSLPAPTNASITELAMLTWTNTASDSDIPPPGHLYYSLINPPSGAVIDTNGVITWTPTEAQGPNTNVVTTVVTDDGVPPLSTTNTLTIDVKEVNVAPALPLQTNRALNGLQTLQVTNTGTDADLPPNNLTYQLLAPPTGAVINANGVITWTPMVAQVPGTYVFTTVVTDDSPLAINDQHLSATNSFSVVVNSTHYGPALPVQTNLTIAELTTMVVTNTAVDTDVPPLGLTYVLVVAPPNATIDTNGIITWTPTELQAPSTNTFTTLVYDGGAPTLTSLNSFVVVVNEMNTAPVLPPQANRTVNGLQNLVVTNTASVSDIHVVGVTYQLIAAPAGAVIDTNGVITWTPTLAQMRSTNTITTVATGYDPLAANGQHLSSTNSFSVVVNEINIAPVLPEQTNRVLAGMSPMVVTNTASVAIPNDTTVTYQLLAGPLGALIDLNGVITWTPSFSQVPSTNVFTTVATGYNPWAVNSQYLSATNSFVVTVNPVHNGPSLLAQDDRTVNQYTTLTVVNTASDSDVPVLSLSYTLINAPAGASISRFGVITWTPGSGQGHSTNIMKTVVTDSGVPPLSATNTFKVVVNEINTAPVLPAQSNRVTYALLPLNITNSAAPGDQPNVTVTYQLLAAPAGAAIDTNGIITWTPQLSQVPSTNAIVTKVTNFNPWAINEQNLSATNSFVITVVPLHNGPALPTLANVTMAELTLLTVTNTAIDTDVPWLGLTYNLINPPAGVTIDTNGVLTWTPSQSQAPSTNIITTVVSDGGTPVLSATNSFTVVVNEINTAPVLPPQPNRRLAYGLQTLSVTNTAYEPDIHVVSLTYQLTQAPVGAQIDSNGVITWAPTPSQVPSTNVITTVVTNFDPTASNAQHLSATNSFTVVFGYPAHNGPSLPAQSDVTIDQYSTLVITNTAIDTDLPVLALTYALTGPAGMTIDTNGVITWTPGPGQGHTTNVVTVSVTDAGVPVLGATNSFSVVVNEINVAPVLPSQGTVILAGRQPLTVTNSATVVDIPPSSLVYQLTSFPAGMAIDSNGVITWTPSVAQVPSSNLVTTVVTDYNPLAVNSQHLSSTNSFVVLVNAVHNGPALPLQPNVTVNQYTTLLITNTAVDSDLPVLGLTYNLVNPPSGASIDANGVITWTPSVTQGATTNAITTIVRDSGTPSLSATNSFIIVVNQINVPPQLAVLPNLILTGQQPMVVTNTGQDLNWPPNSLNYQLTVAPAGAVIDGNGIITWTPSVSQVPSTNLFQSVVTDNCPLAVNGQHLSTTNAFRVIVNAIHNTPVLPPQIDLTITELSKLVVTNAAAVVNVPPLPLTYILVNPPAGMVIDTNGIITWTPAEMQSPSTNMVTTIVADNATPALSATNSFKVVVIPVNFPPDLPPQPDRSLAGIQSLVVTNTASNSNVLISVTYQLTSAPAGAAIDGNGIITWTPTLAQVPSTNLFVTVVTVFNPKTINNQYVSATNAFTVVVNAIHNGPSLQVQGDAIVNEGALLVVINSAVDTDIPPLGLTYRLINPPAGTTIDSSGIIVWVPTEAQGPSTNIIRTVVTDNGVPPLSATNSFSVVVNEVNAAPILPVQTNRTFAGRTLVVTNTAFDVDLPANSLTYQLTSGLPGTSIDTNGIIAWTPTLAQIPSTNVITTVVTDSNPSAVNSQHLSATNSFTVFVNLVHNGPVLSVVSNQTVNEQILLTVTNAASDFDMPVLALTYSLINPPVGMGIDMNGVITWAPTESQGPSTNTVATVVTDNGTPTLSVTNSFTVVVNEVNAAPRLPVQASRALTGRQSLVVTNTGWDVDWPANSLSYQLIGAPVGAAIDTNGIITWTPTVAQVPSTNLFMTVETDYSPWAVNSQHLTATNSFSVVVNAIHNGPALPVQTNLTIAELTLLTITNSAIVTDVPPLPLTYTLVNPPAGLVIDTNGVITWTPSEAQGPSTNTVTTIVTDGGTPALSATNSFSVVVNEINVAPVLPAQSDRQLAGRQALIVTNTASDADIPVNSLTYELLSAPSGASIDSNGIITWTPSVADVPSSNLFRTRVTDYNALAVNNQHLSATNSCTVVVNATHIPPVLPAQTSVTIAEVTSLTITNTGSSASLPALGLGYALLNPPAGALIDTNGVITWTPTEAQGPSTNVLTTVVTDTGIPPLSATNTLTVVVNEINVAPVLPGQSNRSLAGLQTLTVTNTSTDADLPANTLTYQLTVAPAGASIDANGVISWTPTVAQVPSTNVVTTVVTDNNPWAVNNQHLSATNSFTVTVNPTHNGPALPTLSGQTMAEQTTLTVTNTAIDGDLPVPVLSYSLLNAPIGAAIDVNGVITWTPTESQGPGTNILTTVVIDNRTPSLSATNSCTVVVNEVNTAPRLPIQTNQVLTGLQTMVVTNAGIELDWPANTLTYQLLVAPANAAIDTNGIITWTPTVAQVPSTNVITTVVTDYNPSAINSQHLSATNSFTVVVNAIHNGPALPVQTNLTIAELALLTVTNTALVTNVPPLPMTYSLVNPPPGLAINTNGVITWTPSEAQGPSTNTITTIVNDGGTPPLSATNSFTVVVNEVNVVPILPAQADRFVMVLQALVMTNTATDADIPTNSLAYQLIAAPAGATIDTNGIITWTPSQLQVYTANDFTTVVTDFNPWAANAQHLSATNSFKVVVSPMHNPPVLSARPDVTIAELTTLTVTNTATATNVPALGLSYMLLGQPSGATIDTNGVITWTPSEAQGPSTNLITTVATDTGIPALSATNSFTVVVNEINLAPVLPVQTNRTLTGRQTLTVTNTATDADIPANTLSYQLTAAPAGSSINTNGIIIWTPATTQVPSTNLFTTVVTDSNLAAVNAQHLNATNSFTVVVNAIHNGPSLLAQPAMTIAEITTLTVTNTAIDTDLPALALTYALQNPPSGMTIDTNGVITWTPTEAQGPSTNTITTIVRDSGTPALSATNSYTLVVNEINVAPVLPVQNNRTLSGRQTLTVTNTATDADIPVNSLSYQFLAAPAGSSIDPNGIITWTPATEQVPSTNVFTTVITDSNPSAVNAQHLSATNSFTVVVNVIHNPPALPLLSDISVTPSALCLVTNTATCTNVPVLSLTYAMINPPAGATIDANGVIWWTPSLAQAPSTNVITTIVTDNGDPQMSATNSFKIIVTAPVSSFPITSLKITNGVATLTWSAMPGRTYRMQFKNALDEATWHDGADTLATGTTASTTDNVTGLPQRFYRVVALP